MKWVKCKQEAVKRAMQGTGEHMNHPKWHRHQSHQIWLLKRNWSSGFLSEISQLKTLCGQLLILKVDKPSIYPAFSIQTMPNRRWDSSFVIEISQLINKKNDIIKNHYFATVNCWNQALKTRDKQTWCAEWTAQHSLAKKLNFNLIKVMINLPINKK